MSGWGRIAGSAFAERGPGAREPATLLISSPLARFAFMGPLALCCNLKHRETWNSSPAWVPFEKGPKLCSVCRLVPEAPGLRRCSRLVAESAPMRALMLRAAPIAASDAPIIIRGETGTARRSWPVRCTPTALGATSRFWRSTSRLSRPNCSNPSCSATSRARSREPGLPSVGSEF